MKKKKFIFISAIIVALVTCFMNLGLFWMTDEIDMRYWREDNAFLDFVQLLPLFVSPILHVAVSVITGIILRKRNILDTLQRKLFWTIAGGLYLLLMLTVFPACWYYWEIGAGWGVGLYLAVIWYVIMGVSAIWFLIVLGILIGNLRSKAAHR